MKTKKRHQGKLINTREELEMMKYGLINAVNLSITDHEEIINVRDYRRRSRKILEITYYDTTSNNVKNSISKCNIPPLERYNKMSMKTHIINVSLKYLSIGRNSKVIEAVMDTKENIVLEELLYKETETYITRTELVMHTRVIQATSADQPVDHG